MNLLETIILSLIEGLTEFLPISSTGHMILASAAMNLHEDEFVKTFEISIQIGAIMAIVVLYARRFLTQFTLYLKLGTAFIPTAIIGFFAYSSIKFYLFNPVVVSIALIAGGVILILVDKSVASRKSQYINLQDISYRHAFFIGLIQSISMIPGTSRAAATIIGGVYNGFDKKQAAEFSFLLAVPTMIAATGYDLFKTEVIFNRQELIFLSVGLIVAFISAWFAVKLFLKLVERYGFKYFGYYRIVLGILFLIFMV